LKLPQIKRKRPDAANDMATDNQNIITADDIDHLPDTSLPPNQSVADGVTVPNVEEVNDDIPSANVEQRDAGNSKKLKLAGAGVVATMLILIGFGASVGRYQESKAEQKAAEAEQAAAEQKTMATGKVNVADEQKAIANSNFYDLPPPASASAVDATDAPTIADDSMNTLPSNTRISNQPVATHSYVEPVEPPQPSASPTPPRRNNDMVEGRDYFVTKPMQEPAPTVSDYGNSNTITPPPQIISAVETKPIVPPPKGSDSAVLVDVAAMRVNASLTPQQQASTPQVQRGVNGKLAQSLTPTVLADGTAGRRGDTSMLLLKGTSIPCVLKTKIDSTYQGFTACQISKDVYSFNGKTLLIERGSTVFGEQNVQLNQGQARVAILWTRIETPNGVSINIDSPATGQLGEMGVGAKVNSHFWKRFGSSIMLSMIQDGLDAASRRIADNGKDGDKGSNNTTVSNTTSTVQCMASHALKNSINIPPTATINQGTVLNILVARDVDFSSVYQLKKIGD